MWYIALGKNCVFQPLQRWQARPGKNLNNNKNYISEIFRLQQATLLDSFQN